MSLTTEDKKFITSTISGAIKNLPTRAEVQSMIDRGTKDLATAIMVKKGFDEVDQRFNAVHKDIKEIKSELSGTKQDIERLNVLTREHSKELGDLKGLHPNMRHS